LRRYEKDCLDFDFLYGACIYNHGTTDEENFGENEDLNDIEEVIGDFAENGVKQKDKRQEVNTNKKDRQA
jgi:hypothetical protein